MTRPAHAINQLRNNEANTLDVLELVKSPAGSQGGNGLTVTLGANATGSGVEVTTAGTGASLRFLSTNARGDIQFSNRTSNPATTSEGDLFYNATDNVFRYYDGTQIREFSTGDVADSYERQASFSVPNGTATLTTATVGRAAYAGSHIGIIASIDETLTAGTITVTAKVASGSTLVATLNTGSTTFASSTAVVGTHAIAVSDEFTVEVTTSGFTTAGGTPVEMDVILTCTNSSLTTVTTTPTLTLDSAYDGPGAGAGRTITVDQGAVVLDADVSDGTSALSITREPGSSSGAVGASITMGSNSTGDGLVITHNGSGDAINTTGDVTIDGKLTVTGLIDPTGMVFDEQAIIPGGAPGAGKATIWVMNNTPNELCFTNDAGTDFAVIQTLDSAYDGATGGGSGRAVTVDSGAMVLDADATTATNALLITREPASGINHQALRLVGDNAFQGQVMQIDLDGSGSSAQAIDINIASGTALHTGLDIRHAGAGRLITLSKTSGGGSSDVYSSTQASGSGDSMNIFLSGTASGGGFVLSHTGTSGDAMDVSHTGTSGTVASFTGRKTNPSGASLRGVTIDSQWGHTTGGAGTSSVHEALRVRASVDDANASTPWQGTAGLRGIDIQTLTEASSTFNITGAAGIWISDGSFSGSTVVNQYGIYIDEFTGGGTTNRGMDTRSPVRIRNAVAANTLPSLYVSRSPGSSAAGNALELVVGANSTGDGLNILHSSGGTGDAINVAVNNSSTTARGLYMVRGNVAYTAHVATIECNSAFSPSGSLLFLDYTPGGGTATGNALKISANGATSGELIRIDNNNADGDAISINKGGSTSSCTGNAIYAIWDTSNTDPMIELHPRGSSSAISISGASGGGSADPLINIVNSTSVTGGGVLSAVHEPTSGASTFFGIKVDMNDSLGGVTSGHIFEGITDGDGDGLNIDKSPSTSRGGNGVTMTMGANTTGRGVEVTHSGGEAAFWATTSGSAALSDGMRITHGGAGAGIRLDVSNVASTVPGFDMRTTANMTQPMMRVQQTSGAAAVDFMHIDKRPSVAATGGDGIKVTMGANTTGHALNISQSGSGDAINATGNVTVTGAVTSSAPNHASVRYTAISTSQAGLWSLFNTTTYGGTVSTLSSSGITFSSTTGEFTVPNTGIYEITVVAHLIQSATGQLDTWRLYKNNATVIWSGEAFVHSSVDPVERTISVIVPLNASDVVEVQADSLSTNTLQARIGTTFNIRQL